MCIEYFVYRFATEIDEHLKSLRPAFNEDT